MISEVNKNSEYVETRLQSSSTIPFYGNSFFFFQYVELKEKIEIFRVVQFEGVNFRQQLPTKGGCLLPPV